MFEKKCLLCCLVVVLFCCLLTLNAEAQPKSVNVTVSLRKDLSKDFQKSLIGFEVELHHSDTLVFEDPETDIKFNPENWLIATNSLSHQQCQKKDKNHTGFPFDPDEGMQTLIVVAIAPNPGLANYLKPGNEIFTVRLEIDNKHQRPKVVLRWVSVYFDDMDVTGLDFENPYELLEMEDNIDDIFPRELSVKPGKKLVYTWAGIRSP